MVLYYLILSWILLFCLAQNRLSFLKVWKWANGISPISARKTQMLRNLFCFEFFSSGSFWLLFEFLSGSITGTASVFKNSVLNAFIGAIGWKQMGLEKPFEAVSRSTSNIYTLGFLQGLLRSSWIWCWVDMYVVELWINFCPSSLWY